jgi:hypothetical protein
MSVHYQDAWEAIRLGEAGYTFTPRNGLVSEQWKSRPGRRIDYVFVRCGMKGATLDIANCELAFAEPVDGVGRVTTSGWWPISRPATSEADRPAFKRPTAGGHATRINRCALPGSGTAISVGHGVTKSGRKAERPVDLNRLTDQLKSRVSRRAPSPGRPRSEHRSAASAVVARRGSTCRAPRQPAAAVPARCTRATACR